MKNCEYEGTKTQNQWLSQLVLLVGTAGGKADHEGGWTTLGSEASERKRSSDILLVESQRSILHPRIDSIVYFDEDWEASGRLRRDSAE